MVTSCFEVGYNQGVMACQRGKSFSDKLNRTHLLVFDFTKLVQADGRVANAFSKLKKATSVLFAVKFEIGN